MEFRAGFKSKLPHCLIVTSEELFLSKEERSTEFDPPEAVM